MNPLNNQMYEDVYFVNAPKESRLGAVAIRPQIINGKAVVWEKPTARGDKVEKPLINVKIEDDGTSTPGVITLTLRDGTEVTLEKLDVEIYNKEIKEWVMDKPEFSTNEKLKEFYLDTKKFQQY